MSAVHAAPTAAPRPVRWNVKQFHDMIEHGVFRGQRVFLIEGEILEQHHGHPTDPDPRPLRFSREQYHLLGELGFLNDRRVERINGEIIEMSPIGWPHVVGKTKTADALRRVFAGAAWVNEQGVLPTTESDPQPDIGVIPGRMEDYTDHPTTALLIVEVADTTLDRDTTTKAELYATAGIPDYWVLDVVGRQLIVFSDPAPLPDGGAAYRTKQTFGPNDAVVPLAAPAASVKVADLLP